MKKVSLILLFIFISATAILGQNSKGKAEVLYFKANLACCKAKACQLLENDIKIIIEKNYPQGNVVFREIKIADEINKEIVDKYKAGSQTVILVYKKKKKENFVNLSDIVKKYQSSQNREELEKELLAKINETIK